MKNEELRMKSEEFATAMNNEAIKTMRFIKTLMCSVALLLCSSFFISCSEEDNEIEEYPNWEKTNVAFFENLSDSVKALIAAAPERTDWKRIKCWSKTTETEGKNTDYIIVNVLKEADPSETQTPYYTDSVSVHYLGRLLPSTSHPYGYVFDQSYFGDYNPELCAPVDFVASEVVAGFSTALQHMRRGDEWRVYMPYELAYGKVDQGQIPAYSTLVFDIVLVDFWSKGIKE